MRRITSVWVEVIDPVSQRKVDVTIGLHTFMRTGEGASKDEDLTLSVQTRVLAALEAAGFGLSDIEHRWTSVPA